MKKILTALLITALIICAFSACNKTDGKDSDTTSPQGTTAPVPNQTDKPDEFGEPECDYTYKIEEQITVVNESDGGMSTKCLLFPVIDGMKDADVQSEINALLLGEAEKAYKAVLRDIDIYIEEGTVFYYEVTACSVEYASNSFISVKSEFSFTNDNDPYPTIAVYTSNIDINEKKVIDGKDIFSDFTTINNKFISGKFTQEYGIEKLLTLTNYSDMILQYRSDREIYPNVYFKTGHLVINIDLTDSLGYSAGFSIHLSEVKDALKYLPH